MFYDLAFIIISRKPEAAQLKAFKVMMMYAVDPDDAAKLTHSSGRNKSVAIGCYLNVILMDHF